LIDELNEPVLKEFSGQMILGSTAPDIRAITNMNRDQTHFAPLTSITIDEGIKSMFKSEPTFLPLRSTPKPTQAFIVGYMSHLIMDQAWITTMYQRFFAKSDLFPNQVTANVMDRALQMCMDQEASPYAEKILSLLKNSERDISVPFIEQESLKAWREWMESRFSKGFSWDRLNFMAQRRQDNNSIVSAKIVAKEFLDSLPNSLNKLYEKIPWKYIEEYQDFTMQESKRIIKEYFTK
jgi:hypothetical protein